MRMLPFCWFCFYLCHCASSDGAVQMWRSAGGGYINIKSDPSLQFTNKITLSIWAYYRRNYNSPDTQNAVLISKQSSDESKTQFSFERGTTGTALNDLNFYYLSAGGVQFNHYADATNQTPFAVTNVWRHYAVTFNFNSGSTIRFYIDGVAYAGNWLAGDGNAFTLTNSAACLIGASNPTGFLWNGYLSEVAIWNDYLTSSQILLLAKSHVKGMPRLIRPSTLVGYWPLDASPDLVAPNTTTNLFRNRSLVNESHGTAIAQCAGRAEMVCSYPPNE